MAAIDCTNISALDRAFFWSKVTAQNKHTCWEWAGRTDQDGYGRCKKFGADQPAHRLAYAFVNGPIGEDEVVRHRCDNPRCCNPLHLELGTHKDNVDDRVCRGRSARGARNGRARLEEEQVVSIERDPRAATEIAAEYGISPDTVRSIKQHRIWKHLWCRD